MKTYHVKLISFLLFTVFLTGCFASVQYQGGEVTGTVGGTIDPGTISSPSSGTEHADGEIIQTGRASWYGGKFHGRETASGEIFDKWAMTAAHRTLPLGTRLVVERISNGKAVEVKVNDRGPYVDGRILDLSKGAANQLNMVNDGVARVRLYKVGGPTGRPDRTVMGGQPEEASPAGKQVSGEFTIQVGSFEDKSNALDLKGRLTAQFDEITITTAYDRYYRVRVGRYQTEAEAEIAEEGLQQLGFETWIVRSDS